jgi:hypothetical protein
VQAAAAQPGNEQQQQQQQRRESQREQGSSTTQQFSGEDISLGKCRSSLLFPAAHIYTYSVLLEGPSSTAALCG